MPDRWQFYESLLPRELGTSANTPVALLVLGADGKLLYQSENWAVELNVTLFPPRPKPTSFPSPIPSFEGTPLENPFTRPERLPDEPPPAFPLATRYTTTRHFPSGSGAWRVGVISFPHIQVAIAVSLQSIDQEMSVIRNTFLISIPVVLLLVTGGAWTLSGRALRPIRQLTSAIQKVSIKGLDQRVPSSAIDVEFVQLIQVFNQMLERYATFLMSGNPLSGSGFGTQL